jgi:hypothetical protein
MPKIHITLDAMVQPEVQIARSQDGRDRPIVLLKLLDATTEIVIAADAIAAKEIAKALDRATWREAPE